jgi:hypothetical protein
MARVTKGLGSIFLILLVGAIGAQIQYDTSNADADMPVYLVGLWIAVGVALALMIIAGATWLRITVRRYLRSVEILDDWRCTVWTIERQVEVTLFVRDNNRDDASYKYARCRVHFGDQCIHSREPDIGGTYMTRRGLNGPLDPLMIKFNWRNVDIVDPSKASVFFEIVPANWKGARKRATKHLSPNIIDRSEPKSPREAKIQHLADQLLASADRADQKKAARIKEDFRELTQAFTDGTAVRTKLVQAIQQDVSDEEAQGWVAAVDIWVKKTRECIEKTMDPDEVKRFNDLSGLSPSVISGGTSRQQRHFQAIDCYLQRLGQIVDSYYDWAMRI